MRPLGCGRRDSYGTGIVRKAQEAIRNLLFGAHRSRTDAAGNAEAWCRWRRYVHHRQFAKAFLTPCTKAMLAGADLLPVFSAACADGGVHVQGWRQQ
jgi:hypothetical protein